MTIGRCVSSRAGRPQPAGVELAMTADGWRIAGRLALVAWFSPWYWHSVPPGPSKATCGCSDLPTLRQAASGFVAKCGTAVVRADVSASLSYVPTSLSLTLRVEGRTPPVSLASRHRCSSRCSPAFCRTTRRHRASRCSWRTTPRLSHGSLPCLDPARTGTAEPAGRCAVALGQFLVDTINRHDLVTEITKVFADRGYVFAARGASMISEAPSPACEQQARSD